MKIGNNFTFIVHTHSMPAVRSLITLKIAGYALLILTAIGVASWIYGQLKKAKPIYPSPEVIAQRKIEAFWKEHIASFKLCHGTTSLYLEHFKKHGISATYPPALASFIERIRSVWKNHEHDIAPRTNYFKNFEDRYDLAHSQKTIQVSMTADPFREDEYTTGERGFGGEWMRELRHFLWEVNQGDKIELLSEHEKQTILELQALSESLQAAPPMKVKLPFYLYNKSAEDFCSLAKFQEKIKTLCKEWSDPIQLSNTLQHTILPSLLNSKRFWENNYESTLTDAIGPEHLEFEILKDAYTHSYPDFSLAFDEPQELAWSQVGKLRIHKDSLCSELPEYQDSQFTCVDTGHQTIIITRKTRFLTAEQQKACETAQTIVRLRVEWKTKLTVV